MKTHLSIPGDSTVWCTESGPYSPITNVSTLVTCNQCRVAMDMEVEIGNMTIRHITNTVVTRKVAGMYVSVIEFVQTREQEGEFTWNREDVEQLSIHTSLSKEEIVKELRSSGFKPNPNQKAGPCEYVFNAGGTFGFGGLR